MTIWVYRGRRLRQLEWGLWKDLDRRGWFFLCYRPAGRRGPLVRQWCYADGVHFRLEHLQDLVRTVRAQVNARRVGIRLAIPFENARAEYLTELERRNRSPKHIAGVQLSLDRLAEACRIRHVGDLTATTVERFLASEQKRGLSPRTLNKSRTQVSGFCTWALRRSYLAVNPALQTVPATEPRRLPHFPDLDEMPKLVKALPLRARRLVCLLAFTGLRCGSVLSLTRESFRPDGILVPHTKRATEWWIGYDDGCPLWAPDLTDLGRAIWAKDPPTERVLHRELPKALRKAKCAFTAHGFRHAFCSWLAQAGESLQDIAAWAHHSSAQTTERWYAHLRPRGRERADSNRALVNTVRSQCMALALGRRKVAAASAAKPAG
jgi:integrase